MIRDDSVYPNKYLCSSTTYVSRYISTYIQIQLKNEKTIMSIRSFTCPSYLLLCFNFCLLQFFIGHTDRQTLVDNESDWRGPVEPKKTTSS